MANWKGKLPFNAEQLGSLDAFIHEPDTRQGDIFRQGSIDVDKSLKIDWIIKHDLFEGVVVHFSLMASDGSAFLSGEEKTLATAEDLFGDYAIEHDGRRFTVTTLKA